ncbi:hypothetical protein FACS1894139_09330 [Planctomycetales bacterium]|nr:hypothetical protein FACS1894107_07270 [Planctomycetales bacterium]GHT05468.1 hypothetical protein FACS1894139_09330 [Planctomycetales bacterium]
MEIGLSMAMGGSFYRATQNSEKVNKAVNSMLNRLETGEKYQYVHENVAAVIEGSTLKSKVNTNDIANDRNAKSQTELESYMTGQKEMLQSLEALKEVHGKYAALSAADQAGTVGLALTAEAEELGNSITSLSKSASFAGQNLVEANTSGITINASTTAANNTYALDFEAIAITGIGTVGIAGAAAVDAAITALAGNSARAGVVYNNVLGSQRDVMTSIVNSSSQRYSSLVAADDNETSALLSVLSSRMDAISASKQYGGQYMGNSIQLANLLA